MTEPYEKLVEGLRESAADCEHDDIWLRDKFYECATVIERLMHENEELRIRNLELEDAVAKMQEGIRAIQQHQTKRRK